MRYVRIVALIAVLGLAVAACSSANTTSTDTGSGSATNGESTDEGGGGTGSDNGNGSGSGSDGGSSSGSDGSGGSGGASGGSAAFCEDVRNIFAQNEDLFEQIGEQQAPGGGADLGDIQAQAQKSMAALAGVMREIADVAPSEIKNDAEEMAEFYEKAADEGFGAVPSEEFLQANQSFYTYLAQSCSISDVPIPGF